MALLFYSNNVDTGAIEGAAGTKAIYLSDEKALEHFHYLYDDFKEDTEGEDIVAAVRTAFDSGGAIPAIAEEIHHFKIVRTTCVGRLIFSWNPILRTAFTAHHHNIRKWDKLRARFIHKEAIRYFKTELEFYHCAAPILEAAYDLEVKTQANTNSSSIDAEEGNFVHREDNHYLAHLSVGRSFLERSQSSQMAWGENDQTFVTSFLADAIDGAFIRRAKNDEFVKKLEYSTAQSPTNFLSLVLSYHPYLPALTTPSSWLVFAKATRGVWKPVMNYYRTIVIPSHNNEDIKTFWADLPGLWSPRGIIDPTALSIGRRSLGSQERPFRDPIDKMMSDLLWYVLGRAVQLPFFHEQGWPEHAMKRYLDRNWKFLLNGKRYKAVNEKYEHAEVYPITSIVLQNIDEILMERFFIERTGNFVGSPEFMESTIDVFQEARKEITRWLGDDIFLFGPAINVQYLQV